MRVIAPIEPSEDIRKHSAVENATIQGLKEKITDVGRTITLLKGSN